MKTKLETALRTLRPTRALLGATLLSLLAACAGNAGDELEGAGSAISEEVAQEAVTTTSKLLARDRETLQRASSSSTIASSKAAVKDWQVFTLRDARDNDVSGIDHPSQRLFAVASGLEYACYVDIAGGQACAGTDAAMTEDNELRRTLSRDLAAFATSSASGTLAPASLGVAPLALPVGAAADAIIASLAKLVGEALSKAGPAVRTVEVKLSDETVSITAHVRADAEKVVVALDGAPGTTYKIQGRAAASTVAEIPLLSDFDRAFLETYGGLSRVNGERILYGEAGVKALEAGATSRGLVLGSLGDVPLNTAITEVVVMTPLRQFASVPAEMNLRLVLSADVATAKAKAKDKGFGIGGLLVAGRSAGDAATTALRLVGEVWCGRVEKSQLPFFVEALRGGKSVIIRRFDLAMVRDDLLKRVEEGALTKAEYDHFMANLLKVF